MLAEGKLNLLDRLQRDAPLHCRGSGPSVSHYFRGSQPSGSISNASVSR
jgi:hypothetical protein